MSLLSWLCTHKYNRWKPAAEQTRPKRWAEDEEFALACMQVRMCIHCGKSEHKYVHDPGPEKFRRTFDDGDGADAEIVYRKCLRCDEEVMIATPYGAE